MMKMTVEKLKERKTTKKSKILAKMNISSRNWPAFVTESRNIKEGTVQILHKLQYKEEQSEEMRLPKVDKQKY